MIPREETRISDSYQKLHDQNPENYHARDREVFHVGLYPFQKRQQTENLLAIVKKYKTKYELARDGFDLW